MRIQLFGSSLLAVAALVGCGGDDGHIKVPDAKVFKDSAIDAPHMCLSMASLGSGSVGTMAVPQPAGGTGMSWFYKNSMTGTIYFGIAIKMNNDATPDVVYFIVDEPSGGFVSGVPYSWITDPTSSATGAVSFLDTDVDASNNTTQELWPQNGTIQFSMIAKTAGANVFATVSATTYKEIDDNGALVAGGCTSMLGGMNLYLKNTNAAPTRLAPADDHGSVTPDGTFQAIPVFSKQEAIELMKQQAVSLNAE